MSTRLRIQLSFVVDIDDGQDISAHDNVNDVFEAAFRRMYPKVDGADIEGGGKLGITRLKPRPGLTRVKS